MSSPPALPPMDPATLAVLAGQLDHAVFQVQAYFAALWSVLPNAAGPVAEVIAYRSGIVFYEWIVNLKREIPYVWKADWSMVKVLYLLIRYTGLAHAVIDVYSSSCRPRVRSLTPILQLYAYFGAWEPEACRQFVAFIPAFPIFGVVLSHLILLVQCHAVWNRNKLVLIILCPLIVSEVAIMAVSSFTKIEAVQLLTATGPCLPRAMSAFCILYFVSPSSAYLRIWAE